jgi:hypothetical protein
MSIVVGFFGGPMHGEVSAVPTLEDGRPPRMLIGAVATFETTPCTDCGGCHPISVEENVPLYERSVNEAEDGPVWLYRWVGDDGAALAGVTVPDFPPEP